MELRQLRYFVAVAQELHFRRAAERLHVAQPAISEQVRKLEDELGVTLLERSPRRVALTEAGAGLLADASDVLRLVDAAARAARAARERTAARLRIGYTPAALPAVVPRALQALRAYGCAPDTTVRSGGALDLVQAVRQERLDAAVVPLPVPSTGLRVTPLGEQHGVALLASNDRRATEPSLSLEKIAPDRVMLLARDANRPFHDAVVAACRNAGLAPQLVELPGDEVEHAVLAVAAGAGIALLPESVADRCAAPGTRLVPVEDLRAAFAGGVVTRRDSDHEPTSAFLRAVSRAVVRAAAPERTAGMVAA
jgi:DNA-binding transcriptional LysR family regulator